MLLNLRLLGLAADQVKNWPMEDTKLGIEGKVFPVEIGDFLIMPGVK